MASEHPILDAARQLGPEIVAAAPEADEKGRLPERLVDQLIGADLFQLYRPRFLGGPEVAPLDVLSITEELGRHDGSTAWCVQVSNAVHPMLGSIDPVEGQHMVDGSGDLRMAGSARPLGEARRVDGGYLFSGRWDFASNVNQANWYMGAAWLVDPERSPEKPPRSVSGYIPVSEGRIVSTWDVMGMRGTGSDDFVLDNVFVPEGRVAAGRFQRLRTERMYHPRLAMTVTWAPATGVSLGMARGAIETLHAVGDRRSSGSPQALRERREVQAAVGEADVIVQAARALVIDAFGTVWDQGGHREGPTDIAVARSLMAISHAIRECGRAIDIVFHAAGTNAVSTGLRLERFLRDSHSALQHVSGSKNQIEVGGRVLLGLPSEHPYF